MIKNYFKTAWRSLTRYKLFTLINIAGLSIGISAAIVIYLIVNFDFSFDKFEKDNARIYRVVSDSKYAGVPYLMGAVPAPVAKALKTEATGISDVVPFYLYGYSVKITVPRQGQPLALKKQQGTIFADKSYFNLIGYQWLAGSREASLNNSYQVVLTEKRAHTYFPGLTFSQIIGRHVIYNDSVRTTVSGIVKDLEKNSDFIFTDFISIRTITSSGLKTNFNLDDWESTWGTAQLFVKLSPKTTAMQIENQLAVINKKYIKKAKGTETVFKLQPLNDLHFNADYNNFTYHTVHKPVLYSLLALAAFLLLLGCINFINLSTAQASQRSKEIGIRKTMGSSKLQLVFQFLSEALIITILATLLSVILTPVFLKIFADFTPGNLHFDLLHQPSLIIFLVLLALIVSILSGFYPAWILSGYNPVLVLKNQAYANTGKTRSAWLRRSLTVFQFLIAQIFIMATLIVTRQIHYSLNKNMGFKKDAIVIVPAPFSAKNDNRRYVMYNKLKTLPGINMVSLAADAPSTGGTSSGMITYKDGKKEIQTEVLQKYGDTSYLKLYHIRLLAGRYVHQQSTGIVSEVVINETYAHIMGFKNVADAVGRNLDWSGRPISVAGVMADFNQQSLRQPIKPLMFLGEMNNCYNFHIALKSENADNTAWKTTLARIEKVYKQIYPADDFEYDFFDKYIASYYDNERHISSLLNWATGLAIFISCIGLLGLVIYTTNLRIKEIGIRKVLGASVANIVTILSTDFIKLVLAAFIIASPIAWWGMNKWLQGYAYRITINWWLFAISGLLMLIVALITLSFQTIKAALANPVKSLRSE